MLSQERDARALVHVDAEGRVLSANEIALEAPFTNGNARLPELAPCLGEHLREADRDGHWGGTCEFPSGATHTVEITAMRSADGARTFTVAISPRTAPRVRTRHVANSAHREAARSHDERRELLREAQELAHVGCFKWELATDRVQWTDEMHKIFGLEPGSFGGSVSDFIAFVHPDDRELVAGHIQRALASDTFAHGERILRADGSVRHVSSQGRILRDADGKATHMIGACLDVTDRKRDEARLQRQVHGLELLASVARDMLARDCLEIDAAALRRIGDHLGCEIVTHYRAPGSPNVQGDALVTKRGLRDAGIDEALRRRCLESRTSWYFDPDAHDELASETLLREPGIRAFAIAPLLAAGRALGTLSVGSKQRDAFDPDEREFFEMARQLVAASIHKLEAERALAGQEARFRTVLDSAGDAIFLLDAQQRILDVNARACDSLGYTREELLEMPFGDVELSATPGTRADSDAASEYPTSSGHHQRKDGSCFPVEVRVSRATIDGSPMTIAIARDLTERKLLQDQLIQSQKMEAVGLLAGGIAHDFNNLLTVINTTADLMLADADTQDDELTSNLMAIHQAGEQAAELTAQLLMFSRKSLPNIERIELGTALRNCENLLRRVIGENIELFVDAPEQACTVEADARQIEQVLMNLAVNARDAMPDGGRLEMNVRLTDLPEHEALGLELAPGRYAEVVVRDNGCGMDDAVRQRAFEPFFTTKDVGNGTGLGLSVVYGIVHQGNGRISIESQKRRGTRIRILLPHVHAQASEARPPAARTIARGDELVLLVEDDALVRQVARLALESFGYSVVEAASAREALRLAKQLGDALALMLTDVIMPDLDGPRLARDMRKESPELKVLFMSGYPESAVERQISTQELGKSWIRKPFTAASLAQRVRQALDSAPSA